MILSQSKRREDARRAVAAARMTILNSVALCVTLPSQQRRAYRRNDGCSATAAEITGRRRRRSHRDADVARFIHLSGLRRRGQVADAGSVPVDAARCLVGVARNRWRRRLVRFFKFFFLLLVARETAAADASPPRKLVVDTSPLFVSSFSSPTLFDRFI